MKTPELGDSGCWIETNPSFDPGYELGVFFEGIRSDEVIFETRKLSIGYRQFQTDSWSSGKGWNVILRTAELVDGDYSLQIRVSDTVLEATTTIPFKVMNGTPSIAIGDVSSEATKSAARKAEGTISFSAPRAVSATVEVKNPKTKPIRVDFDSKALAASDSAFFWGLDFSTRYSFTIVARNANGESAPVVGTFKTPAPPKVDPPAKSSRSSSRTSSSAKSCPVVLYWRLDRAESALRSAGCLPSSMEASGCESFFGIIRKSNWIVVGQRGSELYACQK